jgi:hypothetical protein
MLQGINSGSEPPWEGAGPLYIQTGPPGKVQDPHGHKPNPWDESRAPLYGVRAPHNRVPGFWDMSTRTLIKARRGPELTRVQTIPYTPLLPAQAETRCSHVASYP